MFLLTLFVWVSPCYFSFDIFSWVFFFLLFSVNWAKTKMGEVERFQLGTVGALTLSVVSSVSIVVCNKALMSTLHFIFGMLTEIPNGCYLIWLSSYLYFVYFVSSWQIQPYLLHFYVLFNMTSFWIEWGWIIGYALRFFSIIAKVHNWALTCGYAHWSVRIKDLQKF